MRVDPATLISRPDPPVPPDPVGAIHIVSSGDPMVVDTDEVRAMAAELRAHGEELDAAAAALRLVGSAEQLGGRAASTMARPGADPGLSGDIAAGRAAAYAAADSITATAARTVDLADGLDAWALLVDAVDTEAERSFSQIVGDLFLDVTGARIAVDALIVWRAVGVVTDPGEAVGPDGVPISVQVDQGVAALDRLTDTFYLPRLLASVVMNATPVGLWAMLRGADDQEEATTARTVAPLVGTWATENGMSRSGTEVRVDPLGVPGLWTPASAGPLGAALGGATPVGWLLSRAAHPTLRPARASAEQVEEVADVIDRIDPLHAESGRSNRTHVEVLRTEHADGSTSFVVVVPGTNADEIVDPDNPMDHGSNVELAAGADAAILEGISEALEAAGARPGDAVGMVGHSQGGLAIARWTSSAAAQDYDLRASVTLSSPVADIPAPSSGHHVGIEITEDAVSGLDGGAVPHVPPGPGTGSRTTYTVDTVTSPEANEQLWPFQGHYPEHSAAAWDGVVEHRGGEHDVAGVQAQFAHLLGTEEEGAVTSSVIVEIARS